jgi:hypothetical protein
MHYSSTKLLRKLSIMENNRNMFTACLKKLKSFICFAIWRTILLDFSLEFAEVEVAIRYPVGEFPFPTCDAGRLVAVRETKELYASHSAAYIESRRMSHKVCSCSLLTLHAAHTRPYHRVSMQCMDLMG